MTIKDKLLSGGYTPAETFVCHVKKLDTLSSVYEMIQAECS